MIPCDRHVRFRFVEVPVDVVNFGRFLQRFGEDSTVETQFLVQLIVYSRKIFLSLSAHTDITVSRGSLLCSSEPAHEAKPSWVCQADRATSLRSAPCPSVANFRARLQTPHRSQGPLHTSRGTRWLRRLNISTALLYKSRLT